ncbi:26s proteasome regulatory subunit 7, psd7, putative [Perkinsus marinus ATCC 50983]|uniref:26s proteasome regulatory subunit 7, psd7, putative n=1 Tax=Perkinsus marinus (strain ATCC 50983 / TXsc) TaxID=423536 RepID=C5LQV1_PERM5|nr:26s proteasome regulatory subunit 7, psd7, putative [Perkinsus marinus ATCC 50983]EER00836.1 26s proteasome regulatory subunit 7, psd7, putative [Perkinsus marinus ATCC 50983]|eukprot:XP_002768118.1 26s proteasome regulatory subunit 7, psd7, putative [Perkinsus marinus ATCC 50983]
MAVEGVHSDSAAALGNEAEEGYVSDASEGLVQSMVEDSMRRTERAESKLEASASLEDRITLLASLVGERGAAAAAAMRGGRTRAGSTSSAAAAGVVGPAPIESSSLVQLRQLCLHLLTSTMGERTLRRSYAVDTLAAAALKASFRRDSLSAGGALELEAACVSLLDAAQAPQKEGEGAMAVLRRMSALKAAVDLTTGSGFLNDQPSAVDDARYCIVNHLPEKETSVEVRTALFRCLALLPHALSDGIRSMIVNTLIKAPLSVADLESSIACAGVLCKKVSSLDSLRKKLKSGGNSNNAAVMVAMARCGLDEGSPMRPLEVLRTLLEVPGDPSIVGIVDGIGGDAEVFGKCCCSLVWRASELGLAGEVFDFLIEDLRDQGAPRTTFQRLITLKLVEVCVRAGGVPGVYFDQDWGEVTELLLAYAVDEAGVTGEAASRALMAVGPVLDVVRCDPSFTTRVVGRLREGGGGDSGTEWRKRFGLCQLVGALVSSAPLSVVETVFKTALGWLEGGVDSSELPRAACALTLVEGCLNTPFDRARWVLLPSLQQLLGILDGLLGSAAISELQSWIISTAALGDADEVDSTADLHLNDRLVILLVGQRVVALVLSVMSSDDKPSETAKEAAAKAVEFLIEILNLLKFLPSPLTPISDPQPRLIRSLADRGIPDRLRVFLHGPTGPDVRRADTGLRLLGEIKCCCCEALRKVIEKEEVLDSGQVGAVVEGLLEDVGGELEEPLGVPPSDWVTSGAVLTIMERASDEVKEACGLLRSISDALAAGVVSSEKRLETIERMVRSVRDGLPVVDFSGVQEGTQVVIPNDLRAVVLLRTLVRVAEHVQGEDKIACSEEMMTLIEVALLKPLDVSRLNALLRLLVTVAPTFPERVRALVQKIVDTTECRDEIIVNCCRAVDALTDVVDVWEEFSRSESQLAYSTKPGLRFAVLSALRHGGSRALGLSVAHMVEESWDSRAAWEQLGRVLETCRRGPPTALSMTLMRALELMAGRESEAVSIHLLGYSAACIETNPETPRRLCRKMIQSGYYGSRRQAVACLLQLAEKSIPVGAVEWGPALVKLYSSSAVRGEEGLCEEIERLVKVMGHVQPRESMETALVVLGGLAMSPSAAPPGSTVSPRGNVRGRSLSVEVMRGRVMEDGSSPVAATTRYDDADSHPRTPVLLPRARALAARLLGVVVANVEVDPADTNSPEAVLKLALMLANSTDEKTVGPSRDWTALYVASLELLHLVVQKYSVAADSSLPRLAAYEAQVVPVLRAALQASYSVQVDEKGQLLFEGRYGSEASAASAYFKCFVTLADCLGESSTVSEEIRSSLVPHVERLLEDCAVAGRIYSDKEEATDYNFLTFRGADFASVRERVCGPVANAAVVLAWVLQLIDGGYVAPCREIVEYLLTTGWPGLSGQILTGALSAIVEEGIEDNEVVERVRQWTAKVRYESMDNMQLLALAEVFDKFQCEERADCAQQCLRRGILITKSIKALLDHIEEGALVDSPFPVDTVLIAPEVTLARCIAKIMNDVHLGKIEVERLLGVLKKCPDSIWQGDVHLADELARTLFVGFTFHSDMSGKKPQAPEVDVSQMTLAKSSGDRINTTVVVHPIVLLSIVDHYNRAARGTARRVVGTLLGQMLDGKLHVTNSFALPFEEDLRDPQVWFVDHNYHEKMYAMFKKVSQKEVVVGWYSSGPRIKPSDLAINEIFRRYCPEPVFLIMDVTGGNNFPMQAYYSAEEASADPLTRRTFVHLPSVVGAFEAEEVGVEHLLRDIRTQSTSTLATRVESKMNALKTLVVKINEIAQYLGQVIDGKLPPNAQIIYNLQNIFNYLPGDSQEDVELMRSFNVETNDSMLCIYLGSILRATVALHNLINNKIANKAPEAEAEAKAEAKAEKISAAKGKQPSGFPTLSWSVVESKKSATAP